MLIDSGWAIPEAREQLSHALASAGFSPSDIRRFLITHVHRDHYTHAVALRREFGTRVTLGAGEQRSLEVARMPGRPGLTDQFEYLHLMGGAAIVAALAPHPDAHASPHADDWELPDDWFIGGEQIEAAGRRLDVINTPGHTQGHVVFHDVMNAALFAGDHVLPQITPSIGFDGSASVNPLRDFLRSLALVRALPDAALYAAHGPVAPSVHQRVDELVDHHGARLEQTERVVSAGVAIGLEIAAQLTWTRRERRFADLDLFNQMLAVCETGAHLDLLESQGRLVVETVDGVRHYRLA
ncbi:MAG: hypothetical protein QOH56_1374 [Pseudonocardiales bacterium]|nr:hypothetical protein [Pseudonocardiales bacterium]